MKTEKKKLLTLIIAAFFAIVANAQDSEHLTFKGVPIDGTLSSFTQELAGKGFRKIEQNDKTAIMKGTFAGNKDCKIYIYTLDSKDVVCKTIVAFPEMDQWRLLNGQYQDLKDMLTQKYGKPASCIEEFQDIYADDDYTKMHYLRMGRCKYNAYFKTEKGSILLTLVNSDYKCQVLLGYIDAINGSKSEEDAYDDL